MTRAGDVVDRAARAIRPRLEPYPRLCDALGRARRALPRPRPDAPIDQVIFEFAHAYPHAFFVQVGANDGHHLDPLRAEIRANRWRGIMVEPVPYVFDRLRAHYGDNPRLALENAAIADGDGVRELWHLTEAEPGAALPAWYDQLGSFRREVVEKHRDAIPDFDRRLVTREVRCMTFDALCAKHGVTHIDLVHVDTEGFDYEIVKLVDLDRWRPRIVMYEHFHLDDDDREACAAHLAAQGYESLSSAVDTICMRTADLTRADDKLVRSWRRLTAEAAV